ncbi:peptidogalycan biosysnthesis protein [Halomonas sp. THAF12]|uniref:peptidogalycan biosysnthesis protein n=1 Tax=Halomonas sp. B23F22_10 TaxID=3459515 RepID=UPI00373F758F
MLTLPVATTPLPPFGTVWARWFGTISSLDQHEWDSLVEDRNFYNSYRWLRSLEYLSHPRSVLGIFGPGGLLAGCPLWEGQPHDPLFDPSTWFRDLPGPWQERFLWVGAYRSTHNELVYGHGSRRHEALALLLHELQCKASHNGMTGVLLPYMPLKKALQVSSHHPDAQVLLHDAESFQPITEGGLEANISSWKKHYRTRTRAEMEAFHHHGNQIDWSPITQDIESDLIDLVSMNRAKHGSEQGKSWMQKVFSSQRKSKVLDHAIAALSRKQGKINAATIFYRFGKSLHARYFGSDYGEHENEYRYFVLSYYAPLAWASQHGIRTSHLSISALEAKAKRGGHIEPLATVSILSKGRLSDSLVERHNLTITANHQKKFRKHLSNDWFTPDII